MNLICLMNYSLFPSLSINIIPKIQGKIEFWVVSSFEQGKRQQSDLITAFVYCCFRLGHCLNHVCVIFPTVGGFVGIDGGGRNVDRL